MGIGLGQQSKVWHYAYHKKSNARVRDWIQDRWVVTVIEIMLDQEDILYIQVEGCIN